MDVITSNHKKAIKNVKKTGKYYGYKTLCLKIATKMLKKYGKIEDVNASDHKELPKKRKYS